VLIHIALRDVSPEKLGQILAKMVEIMWLQAEDTLYRWKEKLDVFLLTSSEIKTSRIVANTINHHFHRPIMKSCRVRVINSVWEQSAFISYISGFLTPLLFHL
jgi:hypothetical protein